MNQDLDELLKVIRDAQAQLRQAEFLLAQIYKERQIAKAHTSALT